MYLEEVERETHVSERGGVVGAQCDMHAVVKDRGERVHGHRSSETLRHSRSQPVHSRLRKSRRRTRTSFLSPKDSQRVILDEFEKTYEIGHISIHMPFSLQISISLGCFAIENLASGVSCGLSSRPTYAYPCPMRFVPIRIASYRFISATLPSPIVSPAWKMKGMCTPSSFCRSTNLRSGSA